MTDYSKLKVTDLKAELKRRGIPQTGLKVKQNYIDKLVEADAAAQSSLEAESAAPEQDTNQQVEEAEQSASVEQNGGSAAQQSNDHPEPQPQTAEADAQGAEPEKAPDAPERDPAVKENQESAKSGDEAEDDQAAAQPVEEASEKPAAQEPAEEPKEPAQEVVEPAPPSEETPVAAHPPTQPSLDTEQSTPAPVEEVVEDTRKRKRRSPSPQPALDSIAQKKVKGEDGSPRVLLKEDVGAENLAPHPAGDNDDVTMKEATQEHMADSEQKEAAPDEEKSRMGEEARRASSPHAEEEADRGVPPSSKHDARFKDLFPTAGQEQGRPASPPRDAALEEDEDRIVEPALHPATSALYIRDFMRPLQPASLKNYLVSLATPPRTSPNPDIILDFFLDSIKTHCFVSFENISAASRVRSALHGTVWPNERDRKPLWVDFVPEEKLSEWISMEQDSHGRGRGGPRWEVLYDETDEGIKAILQEAQPTNAGPGRGRDLGPNVPRAPLGPRGSFADRDPRRGSQASGDPRARGEGFKALDDLFMSTTAKPKLYYQPVPKDVADKRLNRFADLARRGNHPRRGGDEMRRITFEDTDLFVDQGPEYGARRRGGRGRGGGFGGPWRDSWRGRGR